MSDTPQLPDLPAETGAAMWEPSYELLRALEKGISNSEDFRRVASLLILEVGTGRLSALRADLITKYLKLISETLVGPAQPVTNVFAQVMEFANAPAKHQAVDLVEVNESTHQWGSERTRHALPHIPSPMELSLEEDLDAGGPVPRDMQRAASGGSRG